MPIRGAWCPCYRIPLIRWQRPPVPLTRVVTRFRQVRMAIPLSANAQSSLIRRHSGSRVHLRLSKAIVCSRPRTYSARFCCWLSLVHAQPMCSASSEFRPSSASWTLASVVSRAKRGISRRVSVLSASVDPGPRYLFLKLLKVNHYLMCTAALETIWHSSTWRDYTMFTALATNTATVANEINACTIIMSFAHRERTSVSVGENAVLVVNARNR